MTKVSRAANVSVQLQLSYHADLDFLDLPIWKQAKVASAEPKSNNVLPESGVLRVWMT